MNNLQMLQQATRNLTSWQPKAYHEGYVDISVPEGVSKLFKLMNEPRVSVGKVYFSKGCKFKEHSHKQKEYIILYKGCLEVITERITRILYPGDMFYLNIDEAHSCIALEESWAIAITIPASEVFPK